MPITRFSIRQSLAAIFAGAVLVSLAMFVRTPEEIHVLSSDGRVVVTGVAPRSVGSFSITQEYEYAPNGGAFVSPVYRIDPAGLTLPVPVQISFEYRPHELGETSPLEVSLAQFDPVRNRWERRESTVDVLRKHIVANIGTLTRVALLRREDIVISDLVDMRVTRLMHNQPPDMVGYTVDIEYASGPVGEFVLLLPAYAFGGCDGFFAGERTQLVQEVVTTGDRVFRVTVEWQLGDTARCAR